MEKGGKMVNKAAKATMQAIGGDQQHSIHNVINKRKQHKKKLDEIK